MATQWTAGTTSGQVLTAATLNTIGAAWVDYTPTLTQSATVTKTISNARYCQIQKTVFVQVYLIATSAGTAGNIVKIGLPIAARTGNSSTTGIGQRTKSKPKRSLFRRCVNFVPFRNNSNCGQRTTG